MYPVNTRTHYQNAMQAEDKTSRSLADSLPSLPDLFDDYKSTSRRPPTASRRTGVQALIHEIDAYLVDQRARDARPSRPTSAGTLFVDIDDKGHLQASYRNRTHDRDPPTRPHTPRSPPLLVVDNDLHLRWDRHAAAQGRPAMYVEGYDHASRFRYDYDGNIMHVRRASGSVASEYYGVEAREYRADLPLFVSDTHKLGAAERRKRSAVVAFIRGLLVKLDRLGVMQQFKEQRASLAWSQILPHPWEAMAA